MFKNLGFSPLLDYLHWEYEIRSYQRERREARDLDEQNKTLENMKAEGQNSMHYEEEMRENERDRATGSLECDPGGVVEPTVSVGMVAARSASADVACAPAGTIGTRSGEMLNVGS